MSRDGFEARPPRLTSTSSSSSRAGLGFDAHTSTRLGEDPSRQARTHGRGVSTTALPEPRHLPPNRLPPRGRSGPGHARFYTCTSGPAPFRLPRSGPASSKVWWSLQTTPLATAHLAERHAVAEKMLLLDVCNRPTTRAPSGAIDSRARCPSASTPCGPAASEPVTQVDCRLTATLQLQPASLIVSQAAPGPRP